MITTKKISDRGFSCWWEVTVNRTIWNENATTITVEILSLTNVTVYLGLDALSRSTVSNFSSINSTGNYSV